MKIGLVQAVFPAGRLQENYKTMTEFARQAKDAGVEILCFPELSLTGYCRTTVQTLNFMVLEKYISRQDSQVTAPNLTGAKMWGSLCQLAMQLQVAITFGTVEKAADKFFITTYICDVDGQIYKYRKTHLGKREAEVFVAGAELPIFTLKSGARIGILSCSDNHYPEAVQTLALKGARLILAPFAVPGNITERKKIWSKYLVARAYDNRVFVAAVNQLGQTETSKTFAGGAVVYDPGGEIVAQNFNGEQGLLLAEINLDQAEKFWQRQGSGDHNLCFPLVRKPELYRI